MFMNIHMTLTAAGLAVCVCVGGNSKTAMIAAVSPADINYDETLSTLRSLSLFLCTRYTGAPVRLVQLV